MDGASAVTQPAHIALRESTRAAHEAAEASPVMQRLLAGALDETDYRELLDAQCRLLSEWEATRSDWLAEIGSTHGWPYTARAPLLERDLTHVGARVVGAASAAIPRQRAGSSRAPVAAEAAPTSALQCWGELYVVEGSALGGRVIVKRLRERFPDFPHHFYAIGESADEPWHRFQALLDRVLAEPAALQAAIDGALRMFVRFRQALQDAAAHV